MVQTVKNLPAIQETWVQSLGWEDPLENGMTTHSNILSGEFHGQRSLAIGKVMDTKIKVPDIFLEQERA